MIAGILLICYVYALLGMVVRGSGHSVHACERSSSAGLVMCPSMIRRPTGGPCYHPIKVYVCSCLLFTLTQLRPIPGNVDFAGVSCCCLRRFIPATVASASALWLQRTFVAFSPHMSLLPCVSQRVFCNNRAARLY